MVGKSRTMSSPATMYLAGDTLKMDFGNSKVCFRFFIKKHQWCRTLQNNFFPNIWCINFDTPKYISTRPTGRESRFLTWISQNMHVQSQIRDAPHTVVIYSLCHLVRHKIDNCRTFAFGANIIKTCRWGITCHVSYCWILHRRRICSCETRTTLHGCFILWNSAGP